MSASCQVGEHERSRGEGPAGGLSRVEVFCKLSKSGEAAEDKLKNHREDLQAALDAKACMMVCHGIMIKL